MSKTKQEKFTDSLRQSQINTFSGGLNMDIHPLTAPNTVLTDCVNGTMITYNDNEFVLQNERGNTRIDTAKLKSGFIPIGMKEYGGIIYIVSHNPQTNETELGTFPSPAKISEGSSLSWKNSGSIECDKNIIYSQYKSEIIYYDHLLTITNYDKYQLNIDSTHPMLVLEHYLLDENGELIKIELTSNGEISRFNCSGKGILGYKYRPYFLTTLSSKILDSTSATPAKLWLNSTSLDTELANNTNLKYKYILNIALVSVNGDEVEYTPDGESDFFSGMNIEFSQWEKFHDLQSANYISLPFKRQFKINNQPFNVDQTGIIASKEQKYNKVKLTITPIIYDGEYSVTMDNLTQTLIVNSTQMFIKDSLFTKYKYYTTGINDETLEAVAVLDLNRFDTNWENTVLSIGNATYKLYEINSDGNIIGNAVNSAFKNIYRVSDYNITNKNLVSWDNVLKTKSEFEIKKSNVSTSECESLSSDGVTYTRYVKAPDHCIIELLNDKAEVIQSEKICGTDDVKELWESTNEITYTIPNISYEPNKIYLLELTYSINDIKYTASFVTITADYMIKKVKGIDGQISYPESFTEYDRMDIIPLSDWFKPDFSLKYEYLPEMYYVNSTLYKNNKIDLDAINACNTLSEVQALAEKFYIKYTQLYSSVNTLDIPTIGKSKEVVVTINNESPFKCIVSIGDGTIGKSGTDSVAWNKYFSTEVYLEGHANSYEQTVERKYLYDEFKDSQLEIPLQSGAAYNIAPMMGSLIYMSSIGKYLMTDWWEFDIYSCLKNHTLKNRTVQDIKRRKNNRCNQTLGGNTVKGYYFDNSSTNSVYSGAIQLMQTCGLNGSICYSDITESDKYVSYNGNKKKIWVHGKKPAISNYVLVGIDAPEGVDFKLISDAILKHCYYLNPVNKTVYQYTYDSIQVHKIEGKDDKLIYKLYPSHCNALLKDYDKYNVQSWDNLDFQIMNSSTKEDQFQNIPFYDFNSEDFQYQKYTTFLTRLMELINYNPVSESTLKQYYIDDKSLYFDNSEELVDTNGQTTMLSNILLPELYFDKENKVIYCNVTSDTYNSFEYSGGDCVGPLIWNYSMSFADFWTVSANTLSALDKYCSLMFYKTTSYEPNQT